MVGMVLILYSMCMGTIQGDMAVIVTNKTISFIIDLLIVGRNKEN